MPTDPPTYRSYLFTVRVWSEAVGVGQREWRGKLQHVTSGETRYFRDWPTLIAHLTTLLVRIEGRGSDVE